MSANAVLGRCAHYVLCGVQAWGRAQWRRCSGTRGYRSWTRTKLCTACTAAAARPWSPSGASFRTQSPMAVRKPTQLWPWLDSRRFTLASRASWCADTCKVPTNLPYWLYLLETAVRRERQHSRLLHALWHDLHRYIKVIRCFTLCALGPSAAVSRTVLGRHLLSDQVLRTAALMSLLEWCMQVHAGTSVELQKQITVENESSLTLRMPDIHTDFWRSHS